MHDDFARRLNFLQTVKRNVVKIGGRVEVTLFVVHDLLEEHVPAGLTLLPLEQQVVRRRDLVVLVVLDVGDSLGQLAVGANAGRCKAVVDFRKILLQDGHAVLADDDALELAGLDLTEPLVVADVLRSEALGRVGVQNLLDQVATRLGDDAGDQVVAVQYFLVQLAGVRVLEWQVAARHRVQNDAGRPDIRVESVVTLAGNHLRRCVAWGAAGRFQRLAVAVHVGEAEVDYLDVVLVVEQEVLRLQVPVTDFDFMDVLDAADDLLNELAGLFLL